jgi:site-specific DNA recombinase
MEKLLQYGKSGPKAVPRRTIAYVRVSTDSQAEQGFSIDAQEARVAAYAVALGWDVSETIRDAGESAKSLRRPGIGKILDATRRGEVERVIVAKLDRLTRSTRDLADLLDLFAKHDVSLVSVSEHLDTKSATGRFFVGMLAQISQWEREVIGERTRDVLGNKRRSGQVYCGKTPFGFRRDGDKLVPDTAQQRALKTAKAMHGAGATLRQIAAKLEALGATPNNGGSRWYAQSVKHVLTSRMATEALGA